MQYGTVTKENDVQLNKKQIKALENVVAYTYEDEEKHYDENGQARDHIFVSILILNDALKSRHIRNY
jgi:hypothetical protein